MKHVAIVGGGIAGLAAAYYLHERGRGRVSYTLVESDRRFGGKIVSSRESGFVVEGGPDSFLTTKTAALDLCRAVGLGDELIGTNDAGRKVFVWSRGRLRAMPEGVMLIVPTKIMPFVSSPLISWPGKFRMGMDAFIPPRREDGDESLSHFVRRRLGSEALDKIAEPMIAGIYVADAENLSLQSTFPRFPDMERKYGGLLRGVIAQKRASAAAHRANGSRNGKGNRNGNGGAAQSMFMTLRGGLQQMVDAIQARLDPASLLPDRSVRRVTREGAGYALALADGTTVHADDVVFATPAFATADAIEGIDPTLAHCLREIRYVSTATVSLGFKRSELEHPLDGFGFVVPRSEQRKILACTWSSTKFDGRAPEGCVLVRAFIGGARSERLVDEDDAALAQMASDELRAMMGIAAAPVLCQVYRWDKANPQYEVGHQARVAEIDRLAAKHPGLHLAGGAYHGVGIPDCIESAKQVVDEILAA